MRPTAAAASASAGSAEGEPTTPFCTSCSTSAVWPGATSGARSIGTKATLMESGDQLVQQVRDLARAVEKYVEVTACRIEHVFPWFELQLVQPHARHSLEQRLAVD